MSFPARADRLAAAEADLVGVDEQVAAGELDDATASRLRARYEEEIATIRGEPEAKTAGPVSISRRTMAGALIFLVAAAVIVVAAVVAIEPRSGTGAGNGTGEPDLAELSDAELEAVVSANPDVVPMRLQLARRYVESGDFPRALDHYMVILEGELNAEALGYVGWMTYLSGDTSTAAAYLERSLAVDPNFGLSMWFLAQLRWYGQGDATAAATLLQTLLGGDLPSDVRADVQSLFDEVEADR
ncbi:MAG: tetratricopeptide repeat protein [Acidimicrobiia bacterium]